MNSKKHDRAIYGAIGALTAAQTCVVAHQLPAWCAPVITIGLGGLVAWKAARSKGIGDDQAARDMIRDALNEEVKQ